MCTCPARCPGSSKTSLGQVCAAGAMIGPGDPHRWCSACKSTGHSMSDGRISGTLSMREVDRGPGNTVGLGGRRDVRSLKWQGQVRLAMARNRSGSSDRSAYQPMDFSAGVCHPVRSRLQVDRHDSSSRFSSVSSFLPLLPTTQGGRVISSETAPSVWKLFGHKGTLRAPDPRIRAAYLTCTGNSSLLQPQSVALADAACRALIFGGIDGCGVHTRIDAVQNPWLTTRFPVWPILEANVP